MLEAELAESAEIFFPGEIVADPEHLKDPVEKKIFQDSRRSPDDEGR